MHKRNENRLIWESLNGNNPNALSIASKRGLTTLDVVTVNRFEDNQHTKYFIVRILDNVALVWPADNSRSIEDADIFKIDDLTPTGETHTPSGWGGLK